MKRDNELLEDRQHIMKDLAQVSESLQKASAGQREAIDVLVDSSSTMLQDVSRRFTDHLSGEASKMTALTSAVAAGAVDMASLGDSFGLAIELFSASNQSLIENLSRIEETMDKSTSRSDDQMSYYVAQAREIIDQSMLSQREIIDELRGLGENGKLFPAEAS
jgi:methyl-accepting chemotaxis protein